MDGIDQLIVYLCFVLHWTFPEACQFVKETPLKKVKAFIKELEYLKSLEDYQIASNFAGIIATMGSSQKHKYRVPDIIGQPPRREGYQDELYQAAQKANIKLPEEK